MSAFTPFVTRDSRIADISTSVPARVEKGAADANWQQIAANNVSTSTVSWSVQTPSEHTIIDRHIKMGADITLKLTIPGHAADTVPGIVYGGEGGGCFQAFPLNQLMQTCTLTVNQCSSSVQTQDIIGPLLRMSDDEVYAGYDCPSMVDKLYKHLSDLQTATSNPAATLSKANGTRVIPRGAHPLRSFIIERYNAAGALQATATEQSDSTALDLAVNSTGVTDTWVAYLTISVVEPILFASPLIAGDKVENQAGLVGVQSLQLVCNLDGSAKRAYCNSTNVNIGVSLYAIENARLHVQYLSSQPSDLISARSVVPFTQYDRYLTSHTGTVASLATTQMISQSLQLPQIPSRIVVVGRKRLTDCTAQDSMSFLPMSNVSVNFNNRSGLLSGAAPHQLFEVSKRNGSHLEYREFQGWANSGGMGSLATTGSVLVLNPSLDFGLAESLASGSVGTFNFQIQCSIQNTYGAEITPELLVICEYAGVMVTEAGQTQKQTGILSRDVVVQTSQDQFGESLSYIRQAGAGNLMNGPITGSKNTPMINMAKGMSGGARSGGASSGGGRGLARCAY
ncbi:unnamed protein product [Ectocarpus fasciculatus]